MVTHLAVGLIKRRLNDAFPLAVFDVQGVPTDIGAAQALSDADKHQFQLWALSMVEAQPYKGGAHVGDTMIKDLITTVEHENAKMGVFVTLASPTKPMTARAAAAGIYKTEWKDYPLIQILTIQDLFDGKRPEMPWLDPIVFKKAKRETAPTGQGDLGL